MLLTLDAGRDDMVLTIPAMTLMAMMILTLLLLGENRVRFRVCTLALQDCKPRLKSSGCLDILAVEYM